MAQLTWRNVDAPDFSRSLQNISSAQDNFQRSLLGAGTALQDWGKGVKDTNTGNIELALSKYGNNNDLQAAVQSGLLDPAALHNQYGNFDAATIAKYQNELANNLQTREKNQQDINYVNNQDKFGSAVANALVQAGNGNMAAWAAAQQNPEIMGRLLSQAAPGVESAHNQFANRAEQIRSDKANEGIAGMNASTNARRVDADINQMNRVWDDGAQNRTIQHRVGDKTLTGMDATDAGATALNGIGDTPMAQFRQQKINELQAENKSPEYINNFTASMDKQFQLAMAGNPNAPVAKAQIDNNVIPLVKGNTAAANDSINAKYDSKNTLMKTYRSAQEDATDYKGDSNKAIDNILTFAPDSDRSQIRDYVNDGVAKGIPLSQLVASARNNTESTKWGAVKGYIPGFSDNSSKLDVSKALDTAKQLQSSNAQQELASLATNMDVDRQAVTQAEANVNNATNLYQEMLTRKGAQSPQALSAYAAVQNALEAQKRLTEGYRNTATNSLKRTDLNNASKEDIARKANYDALLNHAAKSNGR